MVENGENRQKNDINSKPLLQILTLPTPTPSQSRVTPVRVEEVADTAQLTITEPPKQFKYRGLHHRNRV